ncbi:cardiolipin synthase ClsB [Caldimonas thermodepolymerans]|jgi:cardiolipin synthase|uniref:Cardiolipin synthase B n=1 Tax=Caldimonas thermodepolymerans TaxID=215580 RepID=A0AA46HVB7_9BURK|nr:cardiolipin synthase ClsB [Caldimonas thermodepolymerans]TCP06355.1 cardiolipin synthase [Caldimonas thermodepolymerans]UZG45360.1 cardiolipin synthase ClsB [Caldimonas thermodepolymerans]UZG49112.1 cardiolipin synthase ClsB [Caldimonas thermodepolymerans]
MTPPQDPQLLEHVRASPLAWYAQSRAQFVGGNAVRLLRGGCELFPALVAAVDRARHEVWFATYIFHDDATAVGVRQALERAAARGVRVRVVVDGFGSLATLPGLLKHLREAGVGVVVYRPIKGWWSWLKPGLLRRLHQKLCVVDGEVAFVGGINVIDDMLDLHHGWCEAPRLDYAVEVRGPVVAPIEQMARAVWTRACFGRDWRDELIGLARSPHRVARARRFLRRIRTTRWAGQERNLADMRPVRAAFVVRDNLRQRRTIERSYIEAIRNARTRVDLVSPYFYPGRAFRRALQQAARRGVRVRLLLQGKLDYRIAGLAARALYEELLAHGVHIYEYMPAFLHAKVALVDDDWATVGSSNIDPLSLLLNLEANVIVRDHRFVAELADEIDKAIAASREVTSGTEPGVPGWLNRLRRGLVAWCAHVYLRVAGATGRY